MSIDSSSDYSAFVQFAAAQLQAGTEITPEQAVEQWRAMHPSDDEMSDIEALVQEAIDDVAAGDKGIPFDDVLKEIEMRYGMKPTPKST